MTRCESMNSISRLNRLYELKQAQLEKADKTLDSETLLHRVLTAEVEAISQALLQEQDRAG